MTEDGKEWREPTPEERAEHDRIIADLRSGKTKIEFAAQDTVNELKPWVQQVLQAMGYSEAWVSDESLIGDFHPLIIHNGVSEEEMAQRRVASQEWLETVGKNLGLDNIQKGDSVYAVAFRLQQKEL